MTGFKGVCGAATCGRGYQAAPVMSYVGGGRGAYVASPPCKKEPKEKEHVAVKSGKRKRCCFVLSGTLVAFLLFFAIIVVVIVCGKKHLAVKKLVVTKPFDCDDGFFDWRFSWSAQKKAYCCIHEGKGCYAPKTKPFDCQAGLLNWRRGWSTAKKEWCCKFEHKGCWSRKIHRYDCERDFDHWSQWWTISKKAWCCRYYSKGCPPAEEGCAPPSTAPFDCEAGLSNWEHGWSFEKKKWCCDNKKLGCTTESDCKPDFDWEKKWSEEKKEWCCIHGGVSCNAFMGRALLTSSKFNATLGSDIAFKPLEAAEPKVRGSDTAAISPFEASGYSAPEFPVPSSELAAVLPVFG